MLNRAALIVRPKEPYIAWASELDDSGLVPSVEGEQTVYLIPGFEDDDAVEEVACGVRRIHQSKLDGRAKVPLFRPKASGNVQHTASSSVVALGKPLVMDARIARHSLTPPGGRVIIDVTSNRHTPMRERWRHGPELNPSADGRPARRPTMRGRRAEHARALPLRLAIFWR